MASHPDVWPIRSIISSTAGIAVRSFAKTAFKAMCGPARSRQSSLTIQKASTAIRLGSADRSRLDTDLVVTWDNAGVGRQRVRYRARSATRRQ